jgi:hypothetical protein
LLKSARIHRERLTVEVVGPCDVPLPGAPQSGAPV